MGYCMHSLNFALLHANHIDNIELSLNKPAFALIRA